jgi:hypothetical protein
VVLSSIFVVLLLRKSNHGVVNFPDDQSCISTKHHLQNVSERLFTSISPELKRSNLYTNGQAPITLMKDWKLHT